MNENAGTGLPSQAESKLRELLEEEIEFVAGGTYTARLTDGTMKDPD